MRSKVVGIALLGLTLGLTQAIAALAQQGSGDTELQAQGTLSLATSSQKNSSGGVDVVFGRFLTDAQEVGPMLMTTISGQNKLSGSAGAFYRYNFSTGQVVPYVGLAASGSFSSDKTTGSTTGLMLNFEGGFRYFVDRRTAFSVEASEPYSTKDKAFGKQLNVLFGFSRLWGK